MGGYGRHMPEMTERIDRLESLDAIRQLAAKYSLALDMRDLNSLVGLFPADVRVSRNQSGRRALREWFDTTLREQFTGTAHFIGNHIIEFDDRDHAHGVVYSRNEHETGDEWVIMTMMTLAHETWLCMSCACTTSEHPDIKCHNVDLR